MNPRRIRLKHVGRVIIAERIVEYKAAGVDLILSAFLHFQEEVEYFGKRVLPLVRQYERERARTEKAA